LLAGCWGFQILTQSANRAEIGANSFRADAHWNTKLDAVEFGTPEGGQTSSNSSCASALSLGRYLARWPSAKQIQPGLASLPD